ncbi:CpaE family protein [Paenibacillus sp. WLX1005]|uniref:AAA family ATPase n=1 Tax=Paenibacillus sp. WLX1005 TaxID=3243766 RepID=UPI0039842092
MIMKLKSMIISEDAALIAQLHPLLSDTTVHQIKPDDVFKEFDRISPDIVLITDPKPGTVVDSIQHMTTLQPLARIVLIARAPDFDLFRDCIRAGATDFFVIPSELTLLQSRVPALLNQLNELKKNEQEHHNTQTFKKGRGQVMAFYSAKGGSGKTLIAANFAHTLKLESTAQILLIDLNLQYGGIETVLNIESGRSLADLRPVINELNGNHVLNVVEREPLSQLDILLSPSDGEAAESLNADFVSTLIRTCRRNFDFVIIDLPVEMNELTYTAMEEADSVFYILTPDTPAIRTFKKAESLFFTLGMNMADRLKIIYNKTGKQNELQPKDMQEFISYPVEARLRMDDRGVQSALNRGELLRKAANEKKLPQFSKDIKKWVDGLIT